MNEFHTRLNIPEGWCTIEVDLPHDVIDMLCDIGMEEGSKVINGLDFDTAFSIGAVKVLENYINERETSEETEKVS